MSALCPECREPPHYHSFCTLCAQLFWPSRWKHLGKEGRDREFRVTYFRTGSVRLTALHLGITEGTAAYHLRKRLRLPKFPPDGNRRTNWLPEHDYALAQAIADGATRRETADRLGRSYLSVGMRRGALGLPHFTKPPQYRKGQRHPLADKVAELRRTGMRNRQIGRKLRITKNAVIGIIHRHLKREDAHA